LLKGKKNPLIDITILLEVNSIPGYCFRSQGIDKGRVTSFIDELKTGCIRLWLAGDAVHGTLPYIKKSSIITAVR
jgi:hypothetical protein